MTARDGADSAEVTGRLERGRPIALYASAGLLSEVVFLVGAILLVLIVGTSPAGAAAALILGVGVPLGVTAFLLRKTVIPLRAIAGTIAALAAGEHAARAQRGGPSEVDAIAASLNSLADESDRLRMELQERARLTEMARHAAMRIREHLDAEDVVSEAMTALREGLGCDFVDVGRVEHGVYTFPKREPTIPGLRLKVIENLPPDALEILAALYRDGVSLLVPDLRSDEQTAEIPGPLKDALLESGAVSLLITTFGVGAELRGTLTLLRNDPARPWIRAEVSAVESIAAAVGRGLDHSMLYARERDLVDRLTALDKAKADFLAGVTHDLRSPLTGIVGNAETLSDDEGNPLSSDQRRMVRAIDRNAARLSSLIDNMLMMSRIDLGALPATLSAVDFADVVIGAVEEVRASALEKGLDLEIRLPDHGLPVQGDAEQLDRALANLLTNAVKYTPRGGSITVTADRERGQAVATVQDTGIGIPAGDQPSLFTRFFRASNALASATPGTGLGLAIVLAVVENHHGTVELRSQEGTGTAVTVRLPLNQQA